MYPLQIPDVSRALADLFGVRGKMQFSLGATVQPIVIVGDATVDVSESVIREVGAYFNIVAVAGQQSFFILEPDPGYSLIVRSMIAWSSSTTEIFWGNFSNFEFALTQTTRGKYKDTAQSVLQGNTRVGRNNSVYAFDETDWMGVKRSLSTAEPGTVVFDPPIQVPDGGQFVIVNVNANQDLVGWVQYAEQKVT